jgi:RNA polymerase sigma-70 factor (ECF subfamily)
VDHSLESVTSITLLGRLQHGPADQEAWSEFVARYGWRITAWCRQWGLQEADSLDVTQTVLLKLLAAMQTFRYDPAAKFRAWLKTVTHHAWQDLVRSRRRRVGADDPLERLAAFDDLTVRLEQAYEQEVMERALARVKERVLPATWEAFKLTAIDGLSGAETAARLRLPLTSVYKSKSNVVKLLEAEVRYLEGGAT